VGESKELAFSRVLTFYLVCALLVCGGLSIYSWVSSEAMKYGIQQIKGNNAAIENMMGWGLERQISWGIVTSIFSSLFFLVLFELHKAAERESRKGDEFYENFLFLLGLGFLILGCISALMIPYYYRQVSYLESLYAPYIPKTLIYSLVVDWYGFEILFTGGAATLLIFHILQIRSK
jgi:hypothetical protein